MIIKKIIYPTATNWTHEAYFTNRDQLNQHQNEEMDR